MRLAHLVREFQADTLHLTKTDFENNSNNIIIKTKQLFSCLKPVGRVYGHNISWCHTSSPWNSSMDVLSTSLPHLSLSQSTPAPYVHCYFFTPYMLLRHLITRYRVINKSATIDLVTVFDAILKSRQTREKLQCLYENLMSNNFHRTAVLKKIWFVNWSFIPKDSPEKICGRYVHLKTYNHFLKFSIHLSVRKSREIYGNIWKI